MCNIECLLLTIQVNARTLDCGNPGKYKVVPNTLRGLETVDIDLVRQRHLKHKRIPKHKN